MKNKAILLLILSILSSCAHKKPEQGTPSSPTEESTEAKKSGRQLGDTRAIFHIVDPLGVELILTHVGTRKQEKVLMDKTLSQIDLEPGHWRVSGFVLNSKTYKIMNTSKQFIFQLKKKSRTYVGSYIFQCPKVNQSHLKDMKKMSFFNRYPFSSSSQLCELVVGSDYENVNRVWMTIGSDNNRPLSLGF